MRVKYLVFGDGLLGSTFIPVNGAVVLSKHRCDITDREKVNQVIRHYKPDTAINCAGIVPRNDVSHAYTFKVNSFAPHYIADACFFNKVHFIHISTDCVFNGLRGAYIETDKPDASDIYGMSKIFGEVAEEHLVLRASFIGLPDPKGRGLLHWASQQEELIGYDKVFWNGLTNKELCSKIVEYADMRIHGIRHVHGYTVSKYELLKLAKEVFEWTMPLYKESSTTDTPHVNDKSLRTLYHTGFVPKPLMRQLKELF